MNDDRITFEILNAYVDGELDAADAARVAAAVAESPAVARQVSALSRLHQAVASSVDIPALKAPAAPLFGGRVMAFAGVAALVLFIAGSALLAGYDRSGGSAWLARAWHIHHGWSLTATRRAEDNAMLREADYTAAMPGAYVPDLTAARLYVAHAAIVPFTGARQALLVGYRGTRGCKISLIMFPPPEGLSEVFNFFRSGRHEGYAWRVGKLGYAILSDGMDSNRFRLIAESVRDTSRQRLPIDTRTRIALRRSRDASTPCAA